MLGSFITFAACLLASECVTLDSNFTAWLDDLGVERNPNVLLSRSASTGRLLRFRVLAAATRAATWLEMSSAQGHDVVGGGYYDRTRSVAGDDQRGACPCERRARRHVEAWPAHDSVDRLFLFRYSLQGCCRTEAPLTGCRTCAQPANDSADSWGCQRLP